MAKTLGHKWTFIIRFIRQAFGWLGSGTAVQRMKEAVAEIKAATPKDSLLGAEEAVLILRRNTNIQEKSKSFMCGRLCY